MPLVVKTIYAVGGENYLWNTTQTAPMITVTSPATATYNVTLTDGCGYSATAEHIVDVLPYTEPLNVPDSGFHLCTGIPSGPVIYGAIPPYTFIFEDEILDIIDGASLYSDYEITEVTVTDVCGNTATFTMSIYPCDTTIPNIFTPNSIPNIFTPNNDSENGRFQIFGIEAFPQSSLMVYNRWGKLVFESNNYRNEWSGEEQEDGNYYYIFKRSDGQEYSGYVMLAR